MKGLIQTTFQQNFTERHRVNRRMNGKTILAVLVIFALLVAGIVNSTRYITSTSETVTGTYYYNGNYDFITGSHFNLSKKITNSNGGVWNATAANLQLAIWDLNATGGTVYIPSGDLVIDRTIYGKGKVWLQGSGMDATKLTAQGQTQNWNMIVWEPTITEYFFTISDLTLWGDNTTEISGDLIHTSADNGGTPSDMKIINVMTIHAPDEGMELKSMWGLKLTCSISEYSQGYNLYVDGAQCYIADNYFAYSDSLYGVYLNSGKTTFHNNIVYQNDNTGMVVSGGSAINGNIITGNVFYDNGAKGLWIDGSNHNTTITGNNIYDNTGIGLDVDSNDCIINGNNIYNNAGGNYTISSSVSTGIPDDTFIHNSNGNYWTATAANLQTAIWDLNSTYGGKVYVPAANIAITSTIYCQHGVEIIGQGMEQTNFTLSPGITGFNFTGNDPVNQKTGGGISECFIYGGGTGIAVYRDEFLKFNHLRLFYQTVSGINLSGTSYDCEISNCRIIPVSTGTGIYTKCAATHIRACNFAAITSSGGTGVHTDPNYHKYVGVWLASGGNAMSTIIDCYFEMLLGNMVSGPHIKVSGPHSSVTVLGCTFNNNNGNASHPDPLIDIDDYSQIHISNCNLLYGMDSIRFGETSASDSTIIGNTFKTYERHAINLSGAAYVTITGNDFIHPTTNLNASIQSSVVGSKCKVESNIFRADSVTNAYAAQSVTDFNNNLVYRMGGVYICYSACGNNFDGYGVSSVEAIWIPHYKANNNIITDYHSRAMYIYDAGTVVSNNKILDCGTVGSEYGIYIAPTADNSTITGNTVIGASLPSSIYVRGDDCVVANNVFSAGISIHASSMRGHYSNNVVNATSSSWFSNITVDDVLRLHPRATQPTTPLEGMKYVNSSDHHEYTYLNGAWVAVDAGNFGNYTFIHNSNGKYWTATAANLQLAINDLGNLTGWVDGGNNNISISASIYIGSNCELRNVQLWLANSANKTMIKNYDTANGNNNIYIHDIYLNGNGLNQPEFWSGSTHMSLFANGIWFTKCTNITIKDSTVYNVAAGGLFGEKCSNIVLDNIRFYDMGSLYKYSGNGYDLWSGGGIWLWNCSFATITNILAKNIYSCGIVIESYTSCPTINRNHDTTISNCVVSDASFGYYFEDARDCVITNCIANNCSEQQIYPNFASGFRLHATCRGISLTGCEARSCNYGFLLSGYNTVVTGCSTNDSDYDGYYLSSSNYTMTSCQSFGDKNNGFQIEGMNVSLVNCNVFNNGVASTDDAIKIVLSATNDNLNKIMSIQGCIINNPAGDGIESNAWNMSLIGNKIYSDGHYGITCTGSHLQINDNSITDSAGYPLYVNGCNWGTINSNYLYGGGNSYNAIQVASTSNFTIEGNTIKQRSINYPTGAIVESGTSNYNLIAMNHLTITSATKITRLGANTIVTQNLGNYSIVLPTEKPATPIAGNVYVNTTTGLIGVYTGAAWLWH